MFKRFFKKLTSIRRASFPYLAGAFVVLIPLIVLLVKNANKAEAAVAYWSFDDNGTTAYDGSGNANNGIITNAQVKDSSYCISGNCLYFDGNGDYVSISDSSDLDFAGTDSFSIMGWFRTLPTATSRVLVAKYETSGGDGGYKVLMESDGDITCGIDNDNSGFPSDSASSTAANYDDNNWHHFACVKNGSSSLTLYLDGKQIAQDSSITSSTLANNDPFYIGIDGDGSSNSWQGYIDELKVHREVKSLSEIQADFASSGSDNASTATLGVSKDRLSEGLVGYWPMNATSGDATDASGNDSTMVNRNSTTYVGGKYGNSIDFEADSSQYLSASSLALVYETNGAFAPDAAAATTSSFTPSDNSLLVVLASGGTSQDTTNPDTWHPTITDSAGLTWTKRVEPSGFNSGWVYGATVWTAPVTTGTSMTVSLDSGSDIIDGINISVYSVEDYNSSDPIGGTASDNDIADGAVSITLSETPELSSIVVALLDAELSSSGANDATPGSDFTELLDFGETSIWTYQQIQSRTNSASTNVSWVDSRASGGTWFAGSALALEFHASPDSSSQPHLELTGPLSLSSSINPESNTAATQYNIVGKWDSGDEAYLLAQYGDEIRLYIGGSSSYIETTSANLSTGTWYSILATYDGGSEAKIYINGIQQETSGTISSTISNVSGGFAIGTANTGTTPNNFYDGLVDEVRVYNRLLTASDALALHNWAPDPVGYWNFDEGTGIGSAVVKDSAVDANDGDMAASMTESDWVLGKAGTAIEFDGSDDYINVGDPASGVLDFDNGNFSVALWVKTPNTGFQVLASKVNTSSNNGWSLRMNTSSAVPEIILDDSTSHRAVATSSINDNNWHHVAAVRDGTSLRIYVDGSLEATDSIASAVNVSGSESLNFGRREVSAGGYFTGQLDEIRIYNYARTDSQILSDMNFSSGAENLGDPVSYFAFDEMHGDTAHDSGYERNHANLEGACPGDATCPTWTSTSKANGALYFDDGDSLTIPDNLDYEISNYTLSAWVNRESASSADNDVIIDNRDDDNDGWVMLIDPTTDLLTCSFNTFDATSSTVLAIDTWYHVACTSNGSFLKVYVNGIEEASTALTGVINEGIDATIGSRSYSTVADEFIGYIDEVKIYPVALSIKELLQDMNYGSTFDFGSSIKESSFLASGTGNPPIGYWDFDDAAGGVLTDKSGNGYDGTISGATWEPGKYNSSLYFNGSANVDLDPTANFPSGSEPRTITMWFNAEIYDGSNNDAFFTYTYTTSNGRAFEMFVEDNAISIAFDNHRVTTPVGELSVDTWYHLAVVVPTGAQQTDDVQIYIDGMEQTISTITGGPQDLDTLGPDITIGSRTNNSRYFNGYLDELKIYDYALTPGQIAYEYNRGRPIGWWELDECSGTIAHDLSSWRNDGTITSGGSGSNSSVGSCDSGNGNEMWDNGTSGRYNGSLDFDGTNDEVNIGDIASLELTGAMTIAAWVKAPIPTNPAIVIASKMGDNGFRGYQLDLSNTPGIRFYIATGSTTLVTTTYDYSWADEWQHIVATYEPSTEIALYVNGKKVKSVTSGVPASQYTNNGQDFLIGARDGGSPGRFIGQIDDVRIYNYALTESQVRSIMNYSSINFGN